MSGTWYRVRQVWDLFRRRPTPADEVWLHQWLDAPKRALFYGQQEGDQGHALQVARTLVAQGADDPRLIEAALLHDAGKAPGVALPYRVLLLVAARLAPGWLESLSADRHGWLAPLARAHHHPAIGAAYARAAGCEPDVVALIAHHQRRDAPLSGDLARLLTRLQQVDDRS